MKKEDLKSGIIIKCTKDLTSFCNGEKKIIFIKDKLYKVKDNFGNPCIQIRENGAGYTFFKNDRDDYFEVLGFIKDITITKENIHLFYEFMSDEDLIQNSLLLITGENELRKRMIDVAESLNIQKDNYGKYLHSKIYGQLRCENGFRELSVDYGCYVLKYSFFGVKDTLKPIDEYIADIKESSEYKEYIKAKEV